MTMREQYDSFCCFANSLIVYCKNHSCLSSDGALPKCELSQCFNTWVTESPCIKGTESYDDYKKIMEYEKPVDWTKVPVDTKVYVKDGYEHEDYWATGHFAKYESGKVFTFMGGCTSFTNKNGTLGWEHAKLAEDIEHK